ncbi:MAG: GNAT family N-acetyltransferase [Anaerolineae bacterium]
MIRTRQFALGDDQGLAHTIDAVCQEGQWMRTLRFEPDALWEHAFTSPECRCHLLLLVEDGRDIVGWCRVFPAGGDLDASLGIGLLAPYRDRGIGTDLVRRALDWAGQAGYRQVRLSTRADNARAIHVFRKCGFRFTGSVNGHLLEMTCDIASEETPEEGRRS